MSFVVVIPARYASTRLPGKPLVNINDKPMIVHILDKAHESMADRIIVATDHEKIASIVRAAGGEVCMTSINHQSGIERLAEVVEKCNFSDETIIVNIQVDEPMIPAILIRQVAENLIKNQVEISTLAIPILSIKEVFDQNTVKLVTDARGYAIYFSRATIPWNKNLFFKNRENIGNTFLRHVGIYGYRANFIRRYVSWKPSQLEKIEMLEQLRILWYGEKIHVTVVQELSIISVDTLDDLARVRAELN